jgi:protein O-GlcNAc transferase
VAAEMNTIRDARERFRQGKYTEAAALLEQALAQVPPTPALLYNLGVAQQAAGETLRAIETYRRCSALDPALAEAHNNLGAALEKEGRLAEAAECFRRAVAAKPDHVRFRINLGNTLRRQGSALDALDVVEPALGAAPGNASLHTCHGFILADLGRLDEAARALRRAVTLEPRLAEAHHELARVLLETDNPTAALQSLEPALAFGPEAAETQLLAGRALLRQGRAIEAAARFERAIELDSRLAEAHYFLGLVRLTVTGDANASVACFDRALAIDPHHLRALAFRARALAAAGNPRTALASLERVLEARPNDIEALSQQLSCQTHLCEWREADRTLARLDALPLGTDATHPLFLMAVRDDPAAQSRAASWQANLTQRVLDRVELAPRAGARREKIRLAYVSCDFFEHATSFLLAELLELHDRSQFEVLGVSFGPGNASPLRERVVKTFDRMAEVTHLSDLEVARGMREREIDIAIDLKGYTAACRPGIFGYRPAPVAVNYLGYPGTLAAPYIDYLVADEFLIPEAERAWYTERIAYLPDSYQVNDRRRVVAETVPTRAQAGLPAEGFVFCCFNGSWKISAAVFEVWMRLLKRIERSVLWLLEDNAGAAENLRREAVQHGVCSERLIFAKRLRNVDHLARHRLADLFLDTLPVNAHATASDALWSGLPVLTCAGRAFAGRVAGSLLRAVGLGELITTSLAEYEQLAGRLAIDRDLLSSLRARLSHEREKLPLFDTPRYCRHLESAYRHMWLEHLEGRAPATFTVARGP